MTASGALGVRAAIVVATIFGAAVEGASVSDAALAKLSGGSGYSGVLSSNKTIAHQQLICDPDPGPGSATVYYDTSLVSLVGVFNEPNYQINVNQTFVGVYVDAPNEAIQSSSFLLYGDEVETGVVQVTWSPDSTATTAGLASAGSQGTYTPSGFTQVASSGASDGGTNVFGLEFADFGDPTATANYTIFANSGTETVLYDGDTTSTLPDQLMDSDGDVIPAGQISSAQLGGSLVPEPSSLALLALGSAGLLARRRRRGS